MIKKKAQTKNIIFFSSLGILVIVMLVYGYSKIPLKVENQAPLYGMYSGSTQPSPSPSPSTTSKPTTTATPVTGATKILNVPFTTQAPYGVWDKIHEEACEEASILMAYAWTASKTTMTQEYAEQQIQKLTQWGLDTYGSYDTTSAQTAKMAEGVYGVKSRLIQKPTISDLKNEIDQGHVLVMGMFGQMLDNPYFKPPGPVYHMLVIKGYDSTGFITNDPGTRHGESFHYSYDNLIQSAHDWTGSAGGLSQSPAVAIVFSK